MKLIVKDENIKNEYEIKNELDLIEGIKDYAQVFLPEDDDVAADLYIANEYDELSNGLFFYYQDDYLNCAINCFLLLKEVILMNDLSSMIDKLDDFNKLFKKANYNIEFSIEN